MKIDSWRLMFSFLWRHFFMLPWHHFYLFLCVFFLNAYSTHITFSYKFFHMISIFGLWVNLCQFLCTISFDFRLNTILVNDIREVICDEKGHVEFINYLHNSYWPPTIPARLATEKIYFGFYAIRMMYFWKWLTYSSKFDLWLSAWRSTFYGEDIQ